MKSALTLLFVVACAQPSDPNAPRTFTFGPFDVQPAQELTDLCIAATLDNDEPMYINSVEMNGGVGIHHSNWFWVPDNLAFNFPDGAWNCSDGGGVGHPFTQEAAGFFGGVLFAQSTQAANEIQAFPTGAAIRVPPHSRVLATIHLLNLGDEPLSIPLSLTLTPIAERDVAKTLLGFVMMNESIALPPHQSSKFSVECDLAPQWQILYDQGRVASPTIDLKLYHALSHYHSLGTGLTFEAVRDSDGVGEMIWQTSKLTTGDKLGGMLDPPFDLSGRSKVRFSCSFDNPRDTTVTWGNGDGEMCILFGFSDSGFVWTSGVVTGGNPGTPVDVNGVTEFTADRCSVLVVEGQ
jgi:hypothetical protein